MVPALIVGLLVAAVVYVKIGILDRKPGDGAMAGIFFGVFAAIVVNWIRVAF